MYLINFRLFRTKYLSDEWMITRGFMDVEENKNDQWWVHKPISSLKQKIHPVDLNVFNENLTLAKTLELMSTNSVDCLINFQDGYN